MRCWNCDFLSSKNGRELGERNTGNDRLLELALHLWFQLRCRENCDVRRMRGQKILNCFVYFCARPCSRRNSGAKFIEELGYVVTLRQACDMAAGQSTR